VEHYFNYVDLQEENKNLKERLKSHQLQTKLIGNTPPMQELLYNVEVVAMSDAPVFIRGESGTGKELIAEAIHDNSSRDGKPFLKVNCAAVPETLFESTLFGHEKGSFSGAYKAQKGLFEECDGGTLLLDEISEIPYNMQAKMLRVIQEMRVTRVGSTVEIPVDVRIIASSNRDIETLIEEGKFREDLYFRLNVFPIHVPSLQERIDDLPLIADHFLTVYAQKYKIEKKELLPETLDRLMNYSWPGNIRQLEHVIERAVLYSAKAENILDEHVVLDRKEKEPPVTLQNGTNGTVQTLAEMEKQMIFSALEKTKNHKTRAAELLGITVRTLRNKLHQFEEEAAANS
jgi:transcriptional regulator with PAS, ATPase and Fis domain